MSEILQRSASFEEFLRFVGERGYANPDATIFRTREGLRGIDVTEGPWRFEDRWRESRDDHRFYGREEIFFEDEPKWSMNYAGFYIGEETPGAEATYAFLREALSKPEPGFPIRGPLLHERGDWSYRLGTAEDIRTQPDSTMNRLDAFSYVETINHGNTRVYYAHLTGGKID